jgi:hypothetical protein
MGTVGPNALRGFQDEFPELLTSLLRPAGKQVFESAGQAL